MNSLQDYSDKLIENLIWWIHKKTKLNGHYDNLDNIEILSVNINNKNTINVFIITIIIYLKNIFFYPNNKSARNYLRFLNAIGRSISTNINWHAGHNLVI